MIPTSTYSPLSRRDQIEVKLGLRNKIVAHKKLKEARINLNLIAPETDDEHVFVLVGPTGVGKSTLLNAHKKDLQERYAADMHRDPGLVPYIFTTAVAPIDGNYNWKDGFTRILEEFSEILIQKKIIPFQEVELNGSIVTNFRTLVREELRRSMRNCFLKRGTLHLFIDEGAHLLRLKRGLHPKYQFELIRSLAIELKIPICLSGSYELLQILEEDGQLNRRIEIIHFPRYTSHDIAKLEDGYGKVFSDSVFTLLSAIPIEKEENLHDHVEYFFMKSLGCMGILKHWLMRALKYSLNSEKGVLTRDILEKTSMPNKELKKILKETEWGEAKLKDVSDEELARSLKLESTPTLACVNVTQLQDESTPRQYRKKKQGRIGRRGPSRDPIGGIGHGA